MSIERVGVVGAGQMGAGIAEVSRKGRRRRASSTSRPRS